MNILPNRISTLQLFYNKNMLRDFIFDFPYNIFQLNVFSSNFIFQHFPDMKGMET